jgi:hypothetical protein
MVQAMDDVTSLVLSTFLAIGAGAALWVGVRTIVTNVLPPNAGRHAAGFDVTSYGTWMIFWGVGLSTMAIGRFMSIGPLRATGALLLFFGMTLALARVRYAKHRNRVKAGALPQD